MFRPSRTSARHSVVFLSSGSAGLFVRQVVAQRDAGFSFASPCPGRRKQPFTSYYCWNNEHLQILPTASTPHRRLPLQSRSADSVFASSTWLSYPSSISIGPIEISHLFQSE